MRILVHDYAGHPFQVQLSRGLAGRGHAVRHVFSGSSVTPHGELDRRDDDPHTFAVEGITLSRTIRKYRFLERFKLEREYGGRLLETCRRFRPEAVLSANTPSIVQHRLASFCRREGVRLVSWIQDMYGLAAYKVLKKKLPLAGHLIGRYFMLLDRCSCQSSEGIVVITEDFVPLLSRWGIDQKRIHVIHNWAPLEDLPVRPRNNPWAAQHNMRSPVRFVYSGTLSIRHNPDLLLQLARCLEQLGGAELVVISRGEAVDWLKQQAAEQDMTTLKVLDFQPFDVMADVFGSADVLVAVLEPDAGVFCVPSKVLSYMCAGRSLLAAIPPENLAARIVASTGAGLVVEPTEPGEFLKAARQLYHSAELREQCGRQARAYAEQHFDFERICTRFEGIIQGTRAEVAV